MTEDARFEDGEDGPLHLLAQGPDDLPVLAALMQDAVFAATEMRYDHKARRFAILLNRFRWEDKAGADLSRRPYERVRSLLVVEDVLAVRSMGIDRADPDLILSLLDMSFVPGAECTGEVVLTLAGDGAIALAVEALDLRLSDVTRPYLAPSRKAPDHGTAADD